MKANILCMLIIYTIFNQCDCTESNTYTTKYDNINLDEILSSDRLLTGYINCLLEKGPCTQDGKELKNTLPDAIENDCNKCTEKQKEGSDQVMHYIIDHRPEDWVLLEEKYNSDGSYKTKYLQSKIHEEEKQKENDDKKL